jgi:hypothetical protein
MNDWLRRIEKVWFFAAPLSYINTRGGGENSRAVSSFWCPLSNNIQGNPILAMHGNLEILSGAKTTKTLALSMATTASASPWCLFVWFLLAWEFELEH